MANNFRDRVRDSKKPKYWIPKNEGDFIIGKVQSFRTVTSSYGDAETMNLVEDETEELFSIFLSSVIKHEREKQNIVAGDHVGIKYLGEVEGKNAEYKDFLVLVDRPGGEER